MLNYTGSGRVDYEDVLRAIGHFIDEHNFKEVCIIELEEALNKADSRDGLALKIRLAEGGDSTTAHDAYDTATF